MFLRKSTIDYAVNPNVLDALKTLAVNTSRAIVEALTIAPITNSSGGTPAGALVAVPTQLSKVALSGTNLASRTAFNTAIGKVNNAHAVLAAYLSANGFTAIGFPALSGFNGTVATPGTIAALDLTVGAGIDGSASNSMLRSDFNAVITRQRNIGATLTKVYDTLAVSLGVATVPNANLGKADSAYLGYAGTTAATAVGAGAVATSDLTSKAAADAALAAMANNIATLATKINTILLAAATTATPLALTLIP